MTMESIVKNVRDLDQADRSVLERVVGHELSAGHQLIIQVVPLPNGEIAESAARAIELPEWCNIYQGLSDADVDELDAAIVRAQSGRDFS